MIHDMNKQVNKWERREKLFLTGEFQIINGEGMMEIESHH